MCPPAAVDIAHSWADTRVRPYGTLQEYRVCSINYPIARQRSLLLGLQRSVSEGRDKQQTVEHWKVRRVVGHTCHRQLIDARRGG